jgi:hypothetical protein
LSSAISIISALLPCCCPARGSSIASATRATSAFSIFTFRFHGYHPYAHDLADLGWYIGEYARLMAHSQKALSNPTLAVELRDWVEDFAGTLRRVIEFLELPYDPASECFYERDSRVRTVSRSQVRQPVNARGLGRWRPFEQELQPMIGELERAGPCRGIDCPPAVPPVPTAPSRGRERPFRGIERTRSRGNPRVVVGGFLTVAVSG